MGVLHHLLERGPLLHRARLLLVDGHDVPAASTSEVFENGSLVLDGLLVAGDPQVQGGPGSSGIGMVGHESDTFAGLLGQPRRPPGRGSGVP